LSMMPAATIAAAPVASHLSFARATPPTSLGWLSSHVDQLNSNNHRQLFTPSQSRPKKLELEVKADEKTDSEENQCTICVEHKKCILYGPCNHVASCNTCAQQILKMSKKECPLCRAKIESLTQIFI
jgi:hypothetical protein